MAIWFFVIIFFLVLKWLWKKIVAVYKTTIRIYEFIINNSLLSASILFVIVTFGIVCFTEKYYKYDEEFIKNILVEAHGLIFDLFVIGVIALWISIKGQKLSDIKRYKEEIDDYRFWRSDEGSIRIIGCIKRLNNLRVFEIDLHECIFNKATLHNINLKKSNLQGVVFEECNLNNVIFDRVNLQGTYFKNCRLEKCTFNSISNNTGSLEFENSTIIDVQIDNDYYNKTRFINTQIVNLQRTGPMANAGVDWMTAND